MNTSKLGANTSIHAVSKPFSSTDVGYLDSGVNRYTENINEKEAGGRNAGNLKRNMKIEIKKTQKISLLALFIKF